MDCKYLENESLSEEDRSLMILLMDHKAEPTEIADAWIRYLTDNEENVRSSSSEEFELYRNDFYNCIESILNRSYKDRVRA